MTLSLALAVCGSAPARPARSSTFAFAAPVALTQGQNGGFEPGIQVDRYGNIFVAAHKTRAEDGIAPDPQTSSGARSASWVWTSTDGRHFHDLTPGGPYPDSWTSWPGDEGSLAVDSTGNLYFVDTWVTDVSFTHWGAHGLGRVKVVQHRPDAPTGSPVDDRPWIAANSDGTVMLISNSGTGQVYPLANHGGQASGTGRITVYVSRDFGRHFNSIGYTLKDSGWCYPAADPRPGSRTWYVGCVETTATGQDQSGAMYVFVSHNDGASWHRVLVGHAPSATSAEWPSVAVDSSGRPWMQVTISGNRDDVMHLFSSANHGRSWRDRLIPWKGESVPYSWMAVAPDGTVGVGMYSQASSSAPWQVYAGQWRPGGRWRFVQVSRQPIAGANNNPQGDFFQVAYDPRNRLNVVWTQATGTEATTDDVEGGVYSEIYYARQRSG